MAPIKATKRNPQKKSLPKGPPAPRAARASSQKDPARATTSPSPKTRVDVAALGILLEATHLGERFGFPCWGTEDVDVEERDRRTAVHESGHALVALVEGIDFARIVMHGWVEHPLALGEVERDGVEITHPGTTFEMRLACDVAGAVAEEVAIGDVEPFGIWQDLRVALARGYITRIDADEEPDADGFRWVQEQVTRVRRMLGRRHLALEHLAAELLRTRSLTRHDALGIARRAGASVSLRVKHSPTVPRQELDRCDEARCEMEERGAKATRRDTP